MGITGANARALGIDLDLRKTNTYSVYNEIDFKTCLATDGDSYDRLHGKNFRNERICQNYRAGKIKQIPGGTPEKLKVKSVNCGCKDENCEFCGFDAQLVAKKNLTRLYL